MNRPDFSKAGIVIPSVKRGIWRLGGMEDVELLRAVLRGVAAFGERTQLIYRRNRLIAAVVAIDEAKAAKLARRVTIDDRFEEARELLRRENYWLPGTRPSSRGNNLVRTLDALADGYKRST